MTDMEVMGTEAQEGDIKRSGSVYLLMYSGYTTAVLEEPLRKEL